MADIYVKHKVDDLDGETTATQVIRFGYNRKNYLIDLNDEHAEHLREVLLQHVKAARRDIPNRREKDNNQRTRNANIRAWAESKGIDLPAVGRIPDAIKDQYATETGL